MAERPGDRWFYALLREVSGVSSHRHTLWSFVQIRALEGLTRLEQFSGWRA